MSISNFLLNWQKNCGLIEQACIPNTIIKGIMTLGEFSGENISFFEEITSSSSENNNISSFSWFARMIPM